MRRLAAKAVWAPNAPLAVAAAAVVSALWPVPRGGRSACVEDKVAVVYDHTDAVQATDSGDIVVFCDARGHLDLAPRDAVKGHAARTRHTHVAERRPPAPASIRFGEAVGHVHAP